MSDIANPLPTPATDIPMQILTAFLDRLTTTVDVGPAATERLRKCLIEARDFTEQALRRAVLDEETSS